MCSGVLGASKAVGGIPGSHCPCTQPKWTEAECPAYDHVEVKRLPESSGRAWPSRAQGTCTPSSASVSDLAVRGLFWSSSSFFTVDGFEEGLHALDSCCPSTKAINMAQIAVDTSGCLRCHGGREL